MTSPSAPPLSPLSPGLLPPPSPPPTGTMAPRLLLAIAWLLPLIPSATPGSSWSAVPRKTVPYAGEYCSPPPPRRVPFVPSPVPILVPPPRDPQPLGSPCHAVPPSSSHPAPHDPFAIPTWWHCPPSPPPPSPIPVPHPFPRPPTLSWAPMSPHCAPLPFLCPGPLHFAVPVSLCQTPDPHPCATSPIPILCPVTPPVP